MLRVKYDYGSEAWTVQQGTWRLNVCGMGFVWETREEIVQILKSWGFSVDHFGIAHIPNYQIALESAQ